MVEETGAHAHSPLCSPLLIFFMHFSDRHLSDSAYDSKAPVWEQVLDLASAGMHSWASNSLLQVL